MKFSHHSVLGSRLHCFRHGVFRVMCKNIPGPNMESALIQRVQFWFNFIRLIPAELFNKANFNSAFSSAVESKAVGFYTVDGR